MNRIQRRGHLSALLFVVMAVAMVACGEKDKSKVVVARVGDHEVTLDYFERKMNQFTVEEAPVDFLSREGRENFLETIVNKEVMAIKAEELGMAADGQADKMANRLATMQAAMAMREDVVADYQNPTESEILDYYENLARLLDISYMIFDDEATAAEARGLVVGGEIWQEVATRLNASNPGPNGDWTSVMKYGTIDDTIEEIVFGLPVGEVSEPIVTPQGTLIIRVDSQSVDRIAPLEDMRGQIRASVIKQNSALALERFRKEVFDEYGFEIDEEVLQLVFDAIPEDVSLSDPPPIEDLAPLDLAPGDLGRVLMKYADEEWTVRRYSDYYDASSVFGRPRRENGIGALRQNLVSSCIRELMPIVARDRGYMEKPEARDEYKNRREQQMVTRLYEETIRGSVDVSPQEVEDYWKEHAEDFIQPEQRRVLGVVTSTEADGLAAQLAAKSGMDWPELVKQYCIEGPMKQAEGKLPAFSSPDVGPIAAQAFRMGAVGDVSYPFELGPDQWLVLKLIELKDRVQPSLDEMRVRVGQMVQSEKEEEAFQARVQEWKQDVTIETFPERLMDAVYKPAETSSSVIPINPGLAGARG